MTTCDPAEPMLQLVTPEGERVVKDDATAQLAELTAHIDHEKLRGFYRDMSLVRRFDQEATALQRQGELGLWVQSWGQEAAQIGSGRALAPQDFVFPSYREHGVAYTRGLDLRKVLKQFRGVDHGGWNPSDHNIHLYTLVIGSHVLHATGYAMGIQRDGAVGTGDPTKDAAVVAYFGDGATSQGDVSEGLVFAAVNQAPMIFFCQNNQWAISEPTTRQTISPLYQRGEGFGVPGVLVDGNDVLASYAVTAQALERAHSGNGPTFIEAWTYRMGAHTTSDDPTRYRSNAQEEAWAQRDPIQRVENLLRREGGWDDVFAKELQVESDALGDDIRAYVRGLQSPEFTSIFEHVYAEEHAVVTRERQEYLDYEASFAAPDTHAAQAAPAPAQPAQAIRVAS